MMKITVDDVMAIPPCEAYTRDVVEGLFNGRESLSIQDITELDIPYFEKVNVILQTHMLGEQIEEQLRPIFIERLANSDAKIIEFANTKTIAECAHTIRMARRDYEECQIEQEAQFQLSKILEVANA